MRLLTRDFTLREKILLVILGIILIGLLYFRFVDMPVRDALANAESQKATLESELTVVNAQLAVLQRKQNELSGIDDGGKMSIMPSYNNGRNVTKLLNDVLADYGYSITFSNVTRDGDQVRRNISLQFNAPGYAEMEDVLKQLTGSEYRCLVGDVSASKGGRYGSESSVSVNTSLTFFETMVGGTPDSGLGM